ncbi:DUF1028 domain-containing protein [Synechococcus sp. RSCCF101]|uniref:DUF1028 domain-containing protein n=1 Tax=Synechococcus sp. RSCCF101 TaxID=2511069 RepID=UPI0012443A0E|nr:DUF1028 domain-containing protein [Synechococcus sp. RSCCF101]QEY31895.1 DUF1028 domain-containing protein [Synechococcus sp. RSCCF101]
MTYSIVAWDARTGMTGVAVATKHLAVGSLVPHARAGVGAVATQASTNPYLGPWALDRLEQVHGHLRDALPAARRPWMSAVQESDSMRASESGSEAQAVLDSLLQDDPGRDSRQVHLVDASGRCAAWTGSLCGAWAGHLCGDGFSTAGNFLTGPEPLEAMARVYSDGGDTPFLERLLLALEAGEAAGGDRRGRQSAAVLVMQHESYPLHDYRVDHHDDPLSTLRLIIREASQPYYTEFREQLPSTRLLTGASALELETAAAGEDPQPSDSSAGSAKPRSSPWTAWLRPRWLGLPDRSSPGRVA